MTEKKKHGRFRGVRAELKKVVWPTKKQAVTYTVTTLVIALLIALFCWGLDLIFNAVIGLVL